MGATGPVDAVAQVDVQGVASTVFDHYDGRSHDSQLAYARGHQQQGQNCPERQVAHPGRLSGAPHGGGAVSKMYHAALADHLTRASGLEWKAHERGRGGTPPGKSPASPDELIGEISTRSRFIEEKQRLIDTYMARHGHQPRARTVLKLRAQATLST